MHTVDVVVVDEAQFLDINSIKWLAQISSGYGIPVIFAGLNGDFRGEPFTAIEFIKTYKPVILQLKAKCFTCGKHTATLSRRVVNNEVVFHGEQVLCGDSETYIAVCEDCDTNINRKAVESCC